jgi:ABC-type transporter Mla subunit MlaD
MRSDLAGSIRELAEAVRGNTHQLHELGETLSNVQDDINADTAAIAAAVTDLTAAIAALKTQGVDTTKLDAAVATLTVWLPPVRLDPRSDWPTGP